MIYSLFKSKKWNNEQKMWQQDCVIWKIKISKYSITAGFPSTKYKVITK